PRGRRAHRRACVPVARGQAREALPRRPLHLKHARRPPRRVARTRGTAPAARARGRARPRRGARPQSPFLPGSPSSRRAHQECRMSGSLAHVLPAPTPRTEGPAPYIEIAPSRDQRRARPRLAYAMVVVGGLFAVLVSQLLLSIALADGAYEIAALQADR